MEVAIYGTYQNLLQILLCLVTVSASVFQHTEGRKTFNPNTESISESGVVHPPEVNFHIKRKDSSIENLRLVRRDNIDINSPLCSVQNGEIYCQRGNNKAVAFYHAKDKTGAFAIKVEQENNGKHRRKLDGVLVRDNNALFIEPASPLSRLLGKEHPHRITKRSSSFIATSSSVHIFGRELVNIAEAPHFISDFTFDPPSKEHHDYVVEVLVMIDYSLYKKFLEKSFNNRDEALTQIRYYFAHIVNGMDLRYTSINNTDYSIAIRLTGFFVAKNESDLPFVLTYKQGTDERFKIDGSSTLLGLTNFLTRSKNLPHYDHAMLFTEHDATNGRGHILGTSYLSGICTTMSTSIIVDHGSYNSAGIAAHELGHNLGVIYHDGDTTVDTINCPKELNYIMAPSSAIISSKTKEFSFRFSDCSITQIHRQLRNLSKKKKNCLASEKGPSLESVVVQPYLMIPPGQIEDVHSQCREIYGNESFMCPPSSIEEMCYKMYCYDPFRKICITASEQRAAMGSSCGFKKWCKLGKCVVDDKAPPVPEDCPFPDVPASRTNCAEEASPFRCRDENFYRRCCQSCNKNFTASDLCKDMKIRINGLDCSAFTLKYGTAICELDHNIRNFCCKSCSQTQEAPATPSPDINLMSVSSSCSDNAYVRINGMECRDFVNQYGVQVCARDMVSTHCCGSCLSLQR